MARFSSGLTLIGMVVLAAGMLGIYFQSNPTDDTNSVQFEGKVPESSSVNKGTRATQYSDRGKAPELSSEVWINTDQPIKLADQRGKVVLLEFWTFACINCQHTLPAMNDFYDKYHDQGLVIIGDHFPEFSYERDVDNVRKAVKNEGIKYAVAIDNSGTNWKAYQQRYWPTMYLIDKQGQVRYIAVGEHDYSRTEEAIKALLKE
jgi:peroxiredoxin